jgi:dihydrofolate reductase
VTGGFEEALVLAKKAAGSKDVKIGGGVATVRQYLRAGLIDSLHIATVPENCCSMVWTFMRWGFP